MKRVFIVSIFLIFIGFCYAENFLDVDFVADVVRSFQRPSFIIATLCWPVYEKAHLYTKLASNDDVQINMMQFATFGEVPTVIGRIHHTLFLVDNRCPNATEFIELSQRNKLFDSPFRWLILNEAEDDSEASEETVPTNMKDIKILQDSDVIIANIKNKSYDLKLIYRINSDGDWISEMYGYWDAVNGLKIQKNLDDASILDRLDLRGKEISICFVVTDNSSIYHLEDGIEDHIDTITKVNYPTTNHLLDFLNATRRLVFVNTWGYQMNGSWNGMTGYLVREEVEIGGSPMFFTSERISAVEYIASPTPTRSKFVFQQPKLSYENNLFLLSFRTNVWYSGLALIFLLLLGLFAATVWEWKKYDYIHKKRLKDNGILRANIVDVTFLIFGAACQQGSPVELKGIVLIGISGLLGRIVMFILFATVMFLYTSYSANIVALLQSSSSQIKTLEDLLHSRLKFGVDDTIFNRYYFSTAIEPVRKAIYDTKIAPPGVKPRFMPMEDGVKRLQKGLFAFHMEIGVGYKFVGKFFHESEKCGLKEIQYLQVIDPWMAVRKHTPYKEMFKIGLKRIQEHGLQSRQNQRFYRKTPKCASRGANFVSVSMVDCYPAILVLSYGCVIALGVLVLEIVAKKKQERIRRFVLCGKNNHVLV